MLSIPVALVALLGAPAQAQAPTFEQVTGHDFGERITLHYQMAAYLRRLAQVSDRVSLVEQGASWEGRELLLAVATSPENHARLEAIQQTSRRLADPRGLSRREASALIADQPAVVWFGGSIHGNELSGAEAALKLLEHLATRSDAATLQALQHTVVLIDPMLNPDGRDAFATLNHESMGRLPNPDPRDWGNDFTRWQGYKFRTGHYYFDTNRDWFAHTQRETRERMPTLHAWRPQVAVDMHEMGRAEFYIDPPTDPVNPHFPRFALRWFERFGAAYAAAFDSAGVEYMTREAFNDFYPGYTSNRGFHGAVAMLFEQGSSRGLARERPDGTVRTLAVALEQQYLAAWTAVQVAARGREALLTDYAESQRAAIAEGSQGVRRYLIAPEGDPLLVRELVALLARNAVEVSVLTEAASLSDVRDRAGREVGRRSFPAGTYVVEAAQPTARLIRTLLEPETPVPEAFLRQARARVDRGESPEFYDITAWSLPLLFNVGGYSSTDARALPTTLMDLPGAGETAEGPADYAYVLDGRSAASLAGLYHLKAAGYRVGVLTVPSRIRGRSIPGGSVIVRVGQNDSTVHDAVRDIAGRFGLGVTALASGLPDSGYPALGSGRHTFNVELPRIALLAEDGVSGYSFGWAWYTLDRQYEIPVTVLRSRLLDGPELGHYTVLVLPSVSDSALMRALGENGVERLRQWVRDGGTLVTVGSGTEFTRQQLELIGLRSWYETEEGEGAQEVEVSGVLFRGVLDDHWMAAGYDEHTLPVLVTSERIYLPPEGALSSRRRSFGRYATGADARLSGHAFAETMARLPDAVFAHEERMGRGRVIAFAEDVNYRGYLRGANRLFLNAVILGPSAP